MWVARTARGGQGPALRHSFCTVQSCQSLNYDVDWNQYPDATMDVMQIAERRGLEDAHRMRTCREDAFRHHGAYLGQLLVVSWGIFTAWFRGGTRRLWLQREHQSLYLSLIHSTLISLSLIKNEISVHRRPHQLLYM